MQTPCNSRTKAVPALAALALIAGLTSQATAAEQAPWRQQAEAAIRKGTVYLAAAQREDGAFGKRPHPGITALCTYALLRSPVPDKEPARSAIEAGLENLRSFVQEDGSIQPDRHGVPVYTTSVALLAFDAAGLDRDEPLIRNARQFILEAQARGEAPEGETALAGFGYSKGGRPDMSNTQWAIEALHATQEYAEEPLAEDPDAAAQAKAAYEGALAFIKQCQNAEEDSENYGGVSYLPQDHKPEGLRQKATALVRGRPPENYGAMTYAAMKTMIYADVDRDDPRVQSALHWIREHYTFEKNPGQGMNSYFYYIQTCAKALAALGIPQIAEQSQDWRADLVTALVQRQRDDGSWQNDVGRHWESDPDLVTAYSLIALETATQANAD